MAARKLQTEIDRTLKKVSEGVDLFESIYEKMQASTNQTQKEKLEMDLKTQIKKLQRLRDQIKTWVASNDIKDKSQLLENRKLIETQMEKFKACEKEMKTKAFSTIGLIQAAKLDPKEQEKEEETLWLQGKVEELQMQIEQAEAEIEALQGTGKKRGKASSTAGRLEELEHLNERRKWHVSRLELVLRLLQNGSLTTEKVAELHEDVSYFVESNTEEDFDEDEGIYDELNLDEEEEKFGLPAGDDDDSDESDGHSEVDLPPRTPKKHDEESVASSKQHESPILKKSTLQLRIAKPPPPNPNFAQQPMSSIVKAGLPTPRPVATLPPIRYATAAAAAVAPPPPPPSAPATTIVSPPTSNAPPLSAVPPISSQSEQAALSSPSLTHPSVTSPMLSSAASQQPDGSFYSSQESPAVSEAVPSSIDGPAATSSPQRMLATRIGHVLAISSDPTANGSAQMQPLPSPLPQQVQQAPGASTSGSPPLPSQAQAPQFPPGVKVPAETISAQQQPRPSAAPGAFPGSLSDLVVSFESVKQKALRLPNNDNVHKMLEGGYSSMPQPQDTEKPKYYVPRTPYQTASYYPQTPHALLSTPAIFSQLDVETLFYVFYFLPGTYQQYLAAKELKRQSWRFHVKYLTWFQRHSEPQAITEEYEQGVYVYFDWEGSWCQRKKSDFRFEYRYLSEE
ncbi:CCR4-NOT transcription complex [Armillaria solidipes]|uniref:General negative regulator of transcription subunit n=1 Tax=Armillaria solidipes TaxID=1076256 RepID=A0A2H3BQ17_9AGAR|nr:CCR4-NOT transcription complex [Armillaria solidipes]